MTMRDSQLANRREARHVFDWRPQPVLISKHQDIGASVDENDCVEVEFGGEPLVAVEHLRWAVPGEGPHGRWQLL
jgi:hypothetical protein